MNDEDRARRTSKLYLMLFVIMGFIVVILGNNDEWNEYMFNILSEYIYIPLSLACIFMGLIFYSIDEISILENKIKKLEEAQNGTDES